VWAQAQFNALAASLGGENAHFAFFYDESLSHLIYAGCDIIAVPSMFEPCGLTQVWRRPDTMSYGLPTRLISQNMLPHNA
jgi:glycogen synthase